MELVLWLIPALPLLGFVLIAVLGGALRERGIAVIGAGSVGAAAVAALLAAGDFTLALSADRSVGDGFYRQVLWEWMLGANIGFHLDALSAVMIVVVTFVGFLIHLYSAEHMAGDEGYRRYFAYLNLFVAAMLVLVLADNLLFLYLGWEGVGLASYLLIGHWYRNPANGLAARKAFIVTRIADTAFAVGLFLLYVRFGTFDIQDLMTQAAARWPIGSAAAAAAALLLLAGAMGKSAQVPLQVWLPDAMAGPTPVSALIHAATMVTAGVYLIARTHALFELAPAVQALVAVIGVLTALLAAGAALAQTDIKRVLAYSTISQIGYMFLALGVGAWAAGIFHFMTHAFFKALLFLSAGVVIHAVHEEHDIRKMGGLRRELRPAFWGFLIGGGSLAALPFVTAGFYSKDQILWYAWSSPLGGPWLWGAAWLTALITSVYIFRLIFLVFYGPQRSPVSRRPGPRQTAPLAVLGLLSIVGGWVWIPPIFASVTLLPDYLHTALPALAITESPTSEWLLEIAAMAAALGGVYLAYHLYLRRPAGIAAIIGEPGGAGLRALLYRGWGFDALYARLFVHPYLALAAAAARDVIDRAYEGLAAGVSRVYAPASALHNGRMRWYAAGIAGGSAVLLALVLLA